MFELLNSLFWIEPTVFGVNLDLINFTTQKKIDLIKMNPCNYFS